MEPQALIRGEIRNCLQFVDRADIDRAGGADHEERPIAIRPVDRDALGQRVQPHPAQLVTRDHPQRIAA